jgi:hypothetical protein
MSSTAHAPRREQHERRPAHRLQLVAPTPPKARTAGDVADVVTLALAAAASLFVAAAIFVPQLAGIF